MEPRLKSKIVSTGRCTLMWDWWRYSLLALAWCAREYNYCRPQLTESNVIIIKAGRFVYLQFSPIITAYRCCCQQWSLVN